MLPYIVVTGPECTGKTTLATQLATHFGGILVPEYARTYLDNLPQPYTVDDLTRIAEGQWQAIADAQKHATSYLICDTDLRVIRIWSIWKYGVCDATIDAQIAAFKPHLYLLCAPDLPYQLDPLRENPDDLDALYLRYEQDLVADAQPFVCISGFGESRLQSAIAAISAIMRA